MQKGSGKYTTDIHVRLTPELSASLNKLAHERDRPLSREIRRAIEDYIAKEYREPSD